MLESLSAWDQLLGGVGATLAAWTIFFIYDRRRRR